MIKVQAEQSWGSKEQFEEKNLCPCERSQVIRSSRSPKSVSCNEFNNLGQRCKEKINVFNRVTIYDSGKQILSIIIVFIRGGTPVSNLPTISQGSKVVMRKRAQQQQLKMFHLRCSDHSV